jgi:hypothetical protein
MFVGFVLVLVGGFFLLRNLNIIPYWYGWHEMWPLVLIAVGLAMVFDTMARKRRSSSSSKKP